MATANKLMNSEKIKFGREPKKFKRTLRRILEIKTRRTSQDEKFVRNHQVSQQGT